LRLLQDVTSRGGIVPQSSRDALQRYRAPEFCVFGAVHLSHAAGAKPGLDLKPSYFAARQILGQRERERFFADSAHRFRTLCKSAQPTITRRIT